MLLLLNRFFVLWCKDFYFFLKNKSIRNIKFLSENILLLYKNNNNSNSSKSVSAPKTYLLDSGHNFKYVKSFSKLVFPVYVNISFYNYNHPNKIHPSFTYIYISTSLKKHLILNILKLLNVWVDLSLYIYNIYYYDLKPVFFGTVFLKKEIKSLNWLKLNNLKINFKYLNLLLPYIPFNVSNVSRNYFNLFYKLNITNSVILDIVYHKSTIVYFRKNSIFTLGIVPTTYNIKNVDLAIPTSSDNIFIQLFFLKFILKLLKDVENNKYNVNLRFWGRYI